jgi:hypothetical protein
MVTNICLLSCFLSLGQIGDRQSFQLTPQLAVGQELLYTGSFKEQSLVPGVGFQREYRLQTRLFVLAADKDGWQAVVVTGLELLPNGPGGAPVQPAKFQKGSVRLALVRVDKRGQVRPVEKVDVAVPLDGPPFLEHGLVVPVAGPRLTKQDEWMVPDPGRPAQVWGIVGTEIIGGNKCVKLLAEQESPNWRDPQAAGAAWRRVDQVWFHPQLSVAARVEREIKHRDAAHTSPTHTGILRYELEWHWTYPPGKMFEGRAQDVQNALKFVREAEELLPDHVRNAAALDSLIKRVQNYIIHKEPPEPFRQAMEQVLHRIDAVRKGEVIPVAPAVQEPLVPVATPGNRVANFAVAELTSHRSVRMYDLLDRPVLIVFYNPHTTTGVRTLEFAKKVHSQYEGKVNVLGMAVTHNTTVAVQQHKEMQLPFPIADGTGLHTTFAVEATPRLILINADGVVRGAYTGWGPLVTDEILADLNKCCTGKKAPRP